MSDFTTRSGEGGWGAARADPTPWWARGSAAVIGISANWTIERISDAPAALHALGAGTPPVRRLRWCSPTRAAVVLGRAEPELHLDRARVARRGLEVVRRSSGGGAVLVTPSRQLWADLVVPRDDPLWDDDVGRATWWVGETWVRALGELGVVDLNVHRSALVRRPWSDRICYAGLGPGEVSSAGRKLVGIASRRTSGGALFQCGLLLEWEPEALIDVLSFEEVRSDGVGDAVMPWHSAPDERGLEVLDAVARAAVGLHQLTGAAAASVADVQRALALALPT